MPKRQRSGPRRSRRRNAGRISTITRVHFHELNSITLAAGAAQQALGPLAPLSDRLSAISDAFDEYRLVALKYRFRIDLTAIANAGSMAFYPGVLTTPPGSIFQIGANSTVSMRQSDDDVLLPWTVVPRALLAGEQPWYKSQKAVITADDSIPGQLCFIGTGTDVLLYEVDGVFEFRGEADTGNTPLPRLLELSKWIEQKLPAARERDLQLRTEARDRLLSILNFVETEEVSKVEPVKKMATLPSASLTRR
jgi:hypothetical protein